MKIIMKSLYLMVCLLSAKAAVQDAIRYGRLLGVLWHQGESGSSESLRNAYPGKLITLISSLRSDFNIPDLPFIAGEILGDTRVDFRAFNDVLNATVAGMPNTYVVSSVGLVCGAAEGEPTGSAHFSGRDMVILGQRYAVKMHEVLFRSTKSRSKSRPMNGDEVQSLALMKVTD